MHIYTHETCIAHEVAAGHPERPERLSHLLRHLQNTGLTDAHPLQKAPTAAADDILRTHPQAHLAFLDSMAPSEGVVPVDPDTWMGVHSLAAAQIAAGAVCQGVDDVLSGATRRVFCAVRPPGHHAEVNTAMGFCLLNSVAVGAHKALASGLVEKVAILDFDVHHGNGTVDIFKDVPEVLVCSTFQHPFYPNRMHDVQRPNIINTPLAAGSDGTAFRRAVEQHWVPAIKAHAPELLLISAGFDAHYLDPLAQLNLREADFTWVTELLVDLANTHAGGRIVSTLEGGYDLDALANSVEAHLHALAGSSPA